MFRKILVATDGSERAIEACRDAGRIAKALGSEITIIHIVYVPQLYRGDVGPSIVEALTDDGRRILNESKKVADASGIDAKTRLAREGNPADVIVKESEQGGYDLVVLGNSGLGRTGSLGLGSVTSRVASEIRCSLLIVR
jgi:nucleotide-binding universal stress UspA family protein